MISNLTRLVLAASVDWLLVTKIHKKATKHTFSGFLTIKLGSKRAYFM
ncbi:hypothetical protein PMAG_a3556 [Pseudoalteromonas mariniglutinosa NCIMB 1770]|nr:hypothetical protein [Pseudoalteromonas mariniglutinosa NCIMB 1770]